MCAGEAPLAISGPADLKQYNEEELLAILQAMKSFKIKIRSNLNIGGDSISWVSGRGEAHGRMALILRMIWNLIHLILMSDVILFM